MPHKSKPTDRGGPWRDGKAPDGFVVNGWRKICKGGYVRFNLDKHYHEDFANWVGEWVFLEISDPWAVHVDCWPDRPWGDSKNRIRCFNEKEWLERKAGNTAPVPSSDHGVWCIG